MKTFVLLISAVLCCAFAAPPKNSPPKIPSFVKICNRDQPDFDECLQSSIQDLLPKIARGLKEFDLIPIDPLYLEEALYEYGSGTFTGKSLVKNAYTYGLSNAQFSDVNTNFEDPNNIIIEAVFHLDTAHIEGQYKQQGRFMASSFNGKGDFNITTEDVTVTWKISGALVARDGTKYLHVKQFLVTPKVGNMIIGATNLFEGNEQLSKTMLVLVNQLWRTTYNEMLPYTQEVWDKLFRQISNRVFSRIPFDQLFPTSQ